MNILLFLVFSLVFGIPCNLPPPCASLIYCTGKLLDTVQRAQIFNDSKIFVDLKIRNAEQETLNNFDILMNSTGGNPSKEDISQFVEENFENKTELENWTPSDYKENPKFLDGITNSKLRDFARNIVKLWPILGRKTKEEVYGNVSLYSFIPVPNGFIIPGGRFREYYYWDTYWIIEGLLICEMYTTVRGILDNYVYLVQKYGFIPNGGRIYYLNRSQPPLFTKMVQIYIKYTNDTTWLNNNIKYVEKELVYWFKNKTLSIAKSGETYTFAHYISNYDGPRPESYLEDVQTASAYTDNCTRVNLFKELKSGAETGWDFSSRWISDGQNLSKIHTTQIIPIDLNSFLCGNCRILSNFHRVLGHTRKSIHWNREFLKFRRAIKAFLWNDKDGTWYDYIIDLKAQNKQFYPSNLAPLWSECYHAEYGRTIGKTSVKYLQKTKAVGYPGGIPTSLQNSSQQWDFPNAWPPLQDIVIQGLVNSGDQDVNRLAEGLARNWVNVTLIGYEDSGEMFEKYDARVAGLYGGGGEYTVQSGFGWTNGITLDFIYKYFHNNSF